MQRPAGVQNLTLKWQGYVQALENRVKRMEERLAEALGECTPETTMFLHNYGIDKDRPLPDFGMVRFKTGPEIDQYIDVQRDNEGRKQGATDKPILIRAGRALVIEPRASNTALIHWSTMR